MSRTLVQGTSTNGGTVTVYWYGTTTKPTIYNVPSGGSGASNPITAAYDGAYSFWVEDGHYTVVNGTPTGNLEVKALATPAGGTIDPSTINLLPYLAASAATLQSFYEGVVAGTLTQAGGTYTGDVTNTGGTFNTVTANGAVCKIASASELLTLSTSGTTTDTSANLLPANSIILAVVGRVITTITTATDWALSDTVAASARFTSANNTMTAGTTDVGLLHMAGDVDQLSQGPTQASADKVRVLTTGIPGAGAIRITVFYLQFTAPTS